MLMFRLVRILRFFNASYILSKLGDTAHLTCTFSRFSLSISPPHSPPFIATLHFETPFFDYFVRLTDFTLNWKIPIKQFCRQLKQAMDYSSITFTLPHRNIPTAIFTFHDSWKQTRSPRHLVIDPKAEINLLRTDDQELLSEIMYRIFVSIDSEEFKRIVRAFKIIDTDCDSGVVVTLTKRRVTFSDASSEIVLIASSSILTSMNIKNTCTIGGIEDGVEMKYLINLNPTSFFHDLASLTERVWLYRTTEPGCVIKFPIDSNSRFEIYFPSLATCENKL